MSTRKNHAFPLDAFKIHLKSSAHIFAWRWIAQWKSSEGSQAHLTPVFTGLSRVNLINCDHLRGLFSRGNTIRHYETHLKEEPRLSCCLKGQAAQIHNHRCQLTSAVRSQLRASLIPWSWFHETCVSINHLPHLVKLNPVWAQACCQCSRVSLAVINYITTKVWAGAEWNWRSELCQLRVIYLPICQSILLCLLPFLHYSGWITCVCECVHLHRRPQEGPGWDEKPCHVWRDLNHLEDEQWSELLSDILAQRSVENKFLE